MKRLLLLPLLLALSAAGAVDVASRGSGGLGTRINGVRGGVAAEVSAGLMAAPRRVPTASIASRNSTPEGRSGGGDQERWCSQPGAGGDGS